MTTNTEDQPDTTQKNKDADLSQFNKWIKRMYCAVAAALIITLGMFWYYVDYKNVGTGFSKESGDWGAFGSYVGGVLSPFFSLLAFIALLWTINIQSRALKISSDALDTSKEELGLTRVELTKTADAAQQQALHFQNESKRIDVYRMIEKLVDRIDNNYQKICVRDSLTFIDFVRQSRKFHSSDLPALLILYKDEASVTFLTTRLIERDLHRLLFHLKEYESSEVLRDFYRDQYKGLVNFLSDNDMLLDKEFAKVFISSHYFE